MKTATFDLECDGFIETVKTIWCAVVKDHNTGNIYTFDPNTINSLTNFISTYDCLIGHNCVQYDFPVLKKLYNWEYTGQIKDTLLMSRSQNPQRPLPIGYTGKNPHSVEAWGFRVGVQKVEHNDWSQYTLDMLERCKQDVEIQYKIYNALVKESNGKWENAHKLNVKIFTYLQQQEQYGWLIDKQHLVGCINTLNRWIEKIDRAIIPKLPVICERLETKKGEEYNYVSKPFRKDGSYSVICSSYFTDSDLASVGGPFSRISFRRIDLDSVDEVKDFLITQGWKPSKWNTNDEGKKTSAKFSKDDPFEGIESAVGKLIARRIQCRQRRSTLEGWLQGLREDGRLCTRTAGIATTGRLRHSVVVNVPSPHSKAFFAKQMRQCFIAKRDWKLIGVDSKGNQMRQLAARMDDNEFTNAVLFGKSEDGTDLHSLNQKKTGAKSRNLAKNFFYGCILFGAGDNKTAKLLDTTVDRAREIKKEYLNNMPKLKAVIDGLSKEWRITAKRRFNQKWNRIEYYDGYITGVDGRPILVPFEKDLLCYALQSDEAIHMGVAYVMIHKWASQKGWQFGKDWGMLIWMHDEYQMESRPEIAEELALLACKAIQWAGEWLKIKCPHDGDYKIGNNWYETH